MCARPADSVRADRWLWAARLFKSRALAAAACTGGKVEVNDQSAKPARLLRPGDLVRVSLPAGRRIVRILALAQRRGPAAAARALYDDLTPPAAPRGRRRADRKSTRLNSSHGYISHAVFSLN